MKKIFLLMFFLFIFVSCDEEGLIDEEIQVVRDTIDTMYAVSETHSEENIRELKLLLPSAVEILNKYFMISQMPVVSSQYWNSVHGNTPDEVRQDEEGLQVMRTLGENMAWLLRSIEAGRVAGVRGPRVEPKVKTNFIR